MSINRLHAALAFAVALSASPLWANDQLQHSPYAGEQQRSIKALSAQDIMSLEAGRGMGLSKVAELNHFPGPNHVLELADSLKLSEAQVRHIRQLQAGMQQDAQRLGKQILAKEAELDALFATRRVGDAQARALIAGIGQLQGELRFVHVNAHLVTTRLLSNEQIATYDQLRGYADSATTTNTHHHH